MRLKRLLGLCCTLALSMMLFSCSSNPPVEQGNEYTITIKVVLGEGSKFYVIEEIPPEDAIIVENGKFSMDKQGHLKFVEFQDAKSTEFTYSLKSSESSMFIGQYSMDGSSEDVSDIKGHADLMDQNPVDTSQPGVYRIIKPAE